jgi:MFS family permease
MLVRGVYHRDSWYAGFVFCLVGFFMIYEMNLEVSPAVMAQDLMRDFHVGAKALGASVSIYYWSLAGMQLCIGVLFDRFRTRNLILLGVAMCVCTSIAMSTAESLIAMNITRFIMGFGCSFAWISMLMVGVRWFSQKYYDVMAGVAQCIAAMGGLMGTSFIAYLVNMSTWRHTFLIFAGVGAVLWLLIALFVQESPAHRELDAEHTPKLQLRTVLYKVYMSRHSWWIALYTFAVFAPLPAFGELWGVPFLMQYYDMTAQQVGSLYAPFWIALGVAGPGVGWLSIRLGKRIPVMAGCAIFGAVSFAMMLWGPHMPTWGMQCAMAGIGIAVAGQVLSFPLARVWHDKHVIATVTGFLNFSGMATGIILSWWIGRGIESFGVEKIVDGTPIYALSAYQSQLWIFPGLFVVALLVCLFFLKDKPVS